MKEKTEYCLLMLEKAKHDFIAMRQLAGDEIPEDVFGFHCQQSIEKCFKALIASHDMEFPYTHELEKLYEILADLDKDTEKFFPLVHFTPFSVEIRYKETGYDEVLDRKKAITEIKELIDFTENKVGKKKA